MPKGLFGIDIGNGDFKVCSNYSPDIYTYPAIVGQLDDSYSSLNLGRSGRKIDSMSLKKENRQYAIGNMALNNSKIRNHNLTDDKYVSQDTILLTHAAFAMMTPHIFNTGHAVIGLPIHKMNVAKDMVKTFQGHQFGGAIGFYGEYDGKVRNTELDKVIIVAQPHGTLFNLILDNKGELMNKPLAQSGVAIFDIGFKTNDGVVFKNLEPIGRLTMHSKNGMFIAFEEIKSKINQLFNGLEIKIYEIPQIIKTCQVRNVNIENIISDAFFSLASNIILEIKSKWDDAWEIENMVFTGGGAELLKPYLMQAYKCIFPANCQTSNVEGMLKYATRLWGREPA